MSRIRSRMRSRLTRPSARASGPPGHEWAPRPNAMWACALGAVDAELGRALEPPRVAVGGAVEQHHRRAGRDVDAADRRRRGGRGGSRSSPGSRSAAPPRGSRGCGRGRARSSSCSSGCSARCFSAAASRRAVVSWPAANRNVAVRTTDVTSGVRAVGVGREREVGEHVLARLAPPVLDVRRRTTRRATTSGFSPGLPSLAGADLADGAASGRSPRGTAGGPPRARRAGRRRRASRRAGRRR